MDTPGTHAQGRILCDRYKVEMFLGNVCLLSSPVTFFRFRGVCIIAIFITVAFVWFLRRF
jgi:hypothetical protein